MGGERVSNFGITLKDIAAAGTQSELVEFGFAAEFDQCMHGQAK